MYLYDLVSTLGHPSNRSTFLFLIISRRYTMEGFLVDGYTPVVSEHTRRIMTTYYICLPSIGLGTLQGRTSTLRTRTILS